jgi:hypothetical protein
VDPTPAQLWPIKIDKDSADNFDNQVERTVIGFLNDASYLISVDPERFTASINRLVEDFGTTTPNGKNATQILHIIVTITHNWNNIGQ